MTNTTKRLKKHRKVLTLQGVEKEMARTSAKRLQKEPVERRLNLPLIGGLADLEAGERRSYPQIGRTLEQITRIERDGAKGFAHASNTTVEPNNASAFDLELEHHAPNGLVRKGVWVAAHAQNAINFEHKGVTGTLKQNGELTVVKRGRNVAVPTRERSKLLTTVGNAIHEEADRISEQHNLVNPLLNASRTQPQEAPHDHMVHRLRLIANHMLNQ